MKKHEITKTVEQIVKTEYIAEDGTIFTTEDEAIKYEESARFMLSRELKRLSNANTTHYDFNEGSDDCSLEIFDIQTEEELEKLKRYIYLTLQYNNASDTTIKNCFSDETRPFWIIDNITSGHEVLIFWGYDKDWVWTYGDGSVQGYYDWIKNQYDKIISSKENKEG